MNDRPPVLLSLRTLILITAAAVIGVFGGGLAFLAAVAPAAAIKTGLTAFGVSVLGLHKLVE